MQFASWAASRAAGRGKFGNDVGIATLKQAGMRRLIGDPSKVLPLPEKFDVAHREWRNAVIAASRDFTDEVTHGVAAKMINIYLKAVYVSGAYHDHPRVAAMHPPIDRFLLNSLCKKNEGGLHAFWKQAVKTGWTNFSSEEYETVIHNIRTVLGGKALWRIEEHWQGYQDVKNS